VTPPPSPSLRTLALPERVDVVALVLVVATVWCYLSGVHRLRRRGRHWSAGRTTAFISGAAVIAVATGIYTYEQLSREHPDLCLSCFADLFPQATGTAG